jgi:hypothetical protein
MDKKFYNIGPWTQHYKIFYIPQLRYVSKKVGFFDPGRPFQHCFRVRLEPIRVEELTGLSLVGQAPGLTAKH